MDKLSKLEIIVKATGVSGHEYESKSTYTLNDMDVPLLVIRNRTMVSLLALMDDIDGLRGMAQEANDGNA